MMTDNNLHVSNTMLKHTFIFAVLITVTVQLQAADPIIGTWKLNVGKSTFSKAMQAVPPREITEVTREIEGERIELTQHGIQEDGVAVSFRATFPKQGGVVTIEEGDELESGMLFVETLLSSGQWVVSSMQNGKQMIVRHKVVSADGNTRRDAVHGTDEHGRPFEQIEVYERSMSTGTPGEVGMDAAVLTDLVDDIRKGVYPNRHSLLIFKSHKLVLEEYFDGIDEIWDPRKGSNSGVGIVHHGENVLHDVRSVGKSVVSACVGIAISQGLIQSVDQPVFDFFDEFKQFKNEGREKLTIKHLLTMSSGLDWNEMISYNDPTNSETMMYASKDPYGFVLSLKLVNEPGSQWNYNGGGVEILAAIIRKVSGKDIHEFAREHLFEPLGIHRSEWTKFLHIDAPMGASGLRLTARDMLKFGILYQDEGRWGGQQLLSKQWVQDSHAPAIGRPGGGAYGYLFWISDFAVNGVKMRSQAASGNGDQVIYFDRKNDLIIVSTAGYYDIDIEKNAKLMRARIYPSFRFQPTRQWTSLHY